MTNNQRRKEFLIAHGWSRLMSNIWTHPNHYGTFYTTTAAYMTEKGDA